MDHAALTAAMRLAERGGTVIFMNDLPDRGLNEPFSEEWSSVRSELQDRERPASLSYGDGHIGYVPRGEYGLIALLRQTVPADLEVVPTPETQARREVTRERIHVRGTSFPTAGEALRYHCREVNDGRLYFIFNESDRAFDSILQLRGGAFVVEYDAETGLSVGQSAKPSGDNRVEIQLSWLPWQSRVLHVGDEDVTSRAKEALVSEQSIDEWQLTLGDHQHTGPLASWHTLGFPAYSGIGVYQAQFKLESCANDQRIVIDLGSVFETARIYLNDVKIGDKAWQPYVFDITAAVRTGANRLRVEVANTNTNTFENNERVSGLLGPVRVQIRSLEP
jgi:hypothetical protein